jgi:hypothetical protein
MPREMTFSYDPEVANKLKAKNPKTEKVKGEDCGAMYFIIPTGIPDLKTAYKNAVAKSEGANALADGTLSHSVIFVPIFYMNQCVIVEGIPVKL